MRRTHPVFLLVFAAFLCSFQADAAGLRTYVEKADPTYTYEIVDTRTVGTNTVDVVQLTSQTWEDIVWKHWLIIIRPPEVLHPDNALLIVGGGSNRETPPSVDGGELQVGAMIAMRTKSVVASVMQVPNEPLFGGKNEDEIIAYTYDKYLKGEGEEWPLLLPMVKSAVRAMDTVQRVSKERYGQDIKGFLLTGGSKRGWTSWLTAASGDARVKAIAPFVIDVLNMDDQMRQQMATYGGYSNQVQDYTDLKIQDRMDSPAGQKLLALVDPYAYRDQLTLPKLVMLGTNDPYWTVDAINLYFPGLKGEKHIYYQANTGHDVNFDGICTVTQFYYGLLTGSAFPKIRWKRRDAAGLEVAWDREDGRAHLWQASSPNRDFRESTWSSQPLEGNGSVTVNVDPPQEGWVAYYVEVKFQGDLDTPFGSCTQMTVLPEAFPTAGRAYDPPEPVATK